LLADFSQQNIALAIFYKRNAPVKINTEIGEKQCLFIDITEISAIEAEVGMVLLENALLN
jgi:hypothetical protein